MTDTHAAAARRRRWPRILVGFLFALALLVLLAPRVIGHRWVFQPLLERLRAGDFHVAIDRVRLGWFRPLEISGITVSERDQPSLIAIERIETDRGLLGLIWSGRRPGTLRVTRPNVDVFLLEQENTFQRFVDALDGTRPADRTRRRPAIDVDVRVDQLRVTVRREGEPATLLETSPASFVVAYRAVEGASEVQLSQSRLLDQVQLTPELLELGLELALPPLARAARADGRVSLDLHHCRVPLDRPEDVQASGRLVVHHGRAALQEAWASRVAAAAQVVTSRRVPTELVLFDEVTVPFEVARRRVHHEGLRFGFPEYDDRLQFASRGSVGFDRTLEMEVDVPIPIEQLARRETVRRLGVPTITVPVAGTLDDPEVDWSTGASQLSELAGTLREALGDDAALADAVLRAVEAAPDGVPPAVGAATDVLRELVERRRQARAARRAGDAAEPGGASAEEEPAADEPLRRRAIRGLLRRLRRDSEAAPEERTAPEESAEPGGGGTPEPVAL